MRRVQRFNLPASKIGLRYRVSPFDLACCLLAPLGAFALRDPTFLGQHDFTAVEIYTSASFGISIFALVQFRVGHGLSRFFSFHDAVEIAKAAALTVSTASLLMFSLTRLEAIPRSILLIHFLVMVSLLVAARLTRRTYEQRREEQPEPAKPQPEDVIVICANHLAWFYIRTLDTFALGNRRIAAVLDDNSRIRGRSIFGHMILGGSDSAPAVIDELQQHGVEIGAVVICERRREYAIALANGLQAFCASRGLKLELLAEQLGIMYDGASAAAEESVSELRSAFEVGNRSPYLTVKPIVDRVASALFMAMLLPLFTLVALLISMTIGTPVIFWQKRLGRGGSPIYIYKFRTLRNPFDSTGRRLSEDERCPRIGRILRALRLDELPQLYNVLKGDMSFVGPRPLLPVDQPEDTNLRLSVLPGLTGWAQIHGGKLITPDEKNRLDVWYIRNISLALDLKIVLRTAMVLFTGDRRKETSDFGYKLRADPAVE